MTVAGTFNPYEWSTCQLNWWEERFHHANTRYDEPTLRVRPEEDEIENIPRVTRVTKPVAEAFTFENDETPDEHWLSVTHKTYVWHHPDTESVTRRRMNTTQEQLQEILSAGSTRYLPDYSMPYQSPKDRFTTIYMKSYVRHI
jgi:hypothetical protein